MSTNMAELTQRAESAKDYVQSHPYTVATLLGVSTALVSSAFAYWRLKAKPHPNTLPMDLPFHPFFGHVPSVAALVKSKQWHYEQIRMIASEEANEVGVVTMCMPGILIPHLHYIVDPDSIKFLFNDLNLPKGQMVTNCFEEIIGDSIFGTSGEAWQSHRKIATPMFSQHNLQGFMFDCSRDAAQRVVDMFKTRMIEDESGKISTTVDMFDVLGRFTMDVIVEICFGKKCGSIEAYPEEFAFGTAFDRAFDFSTNRVRDPLWKIKKYFQIGGEKQMTKDVKTMYDFVDEMLDMEGRKQMIIDETGINKHDIISLYLESQSKTNDESGSSDSCMDQRSLRFIAMSFIVAGRDTTRNLLAWCLALMCTSEKKWMERVMAEIRGIDSKDPSYEDINKRLRLTECVLLETLRLYPSVVATDRVIEEDVTLPNGIKLFKGEVIEYNHLAHARNTKVYGKDAAEFKPMRWWDKGINTFPSHVFGAFHIEPRLCLGRKLALTEAKTFLFYFLRAFDHRSVGDVFPPLPTSALLIMEDGWDVIVSVK